jgi:hypothetical protein
MHPMDPAEFRMLLERFGKETIQQAEERGRNGAIASVLELLRRARMNPVTKTWLVNQVTELRAVNSRRQDTSR